MLIPALHQRLTWTLALALGATGTLLAQDPPKKEREQERERSRPAREAPPARTEQRERERPPQRQAPPPEVRQQQPQQERQQQPQRQPPQPPLQQPASTPPPSVQRDRESRQERQRQQQQQQPAIAPPVTREPTRQPNYDRRGDPGVRPSNSGGGFTRTDSPRPSSSDRRPADAPARPGFTRDQQGRVEAYRSRSGSEVRYRPDGRVGVVRTGNMTIEHTSVRSTRIVVERVDRTVIVTNRSGHGYIQRPFEYRGHELVNRTYYVRGQSYTRYYNPYRYNGVVLHAYVPVRYYNPGFYGWFSIRWGAPVYYPWGWVRDPWYGYYRGYFTPYPYYSSPGFWLTDYIISTRLAEAYSERAAAGGGAYYDGDVRLSPEVKESIAIEVERQLAAERAEADAIARNEMPDPQGGFPRMLADGNPHVFVVSYNLDVIDNSGQSCSVGRGDVLQLSAPPPANAVAALLEVVASSRPGGCRVGSRVTVGLEDLQDIYNQMRETLSQGVEELRSKSGQNGVPSLPPGAGMAPRPASYMESAPPPDPQVATELSREAQNAERVEQDVTNEAASDPEGRSTAPPVTVSLGQTIDEVVGSLGNPRQIVNAGNKQVYVYPKLKITFRNGKVADVE